MTTPICGVDIGMERLDAALSGQENARKHLVVERTPEGVARLAEWCRAHRVRLVVLEATGGYERLVHRLLWAEGLPCAIANPRQVRHFAEAIGKLEKTDRIDAGVIADFGATGKLRPKAPDDAAQARLGELVTRRRQLVRDKVACQNRARLVEDEAVRASIERQIDFLREEVALFDREIAEQTRTAPLASALLDAFCEIKGVSTASAALVLADLPEIGLLTGKQAAKLTGTAPLAKDSATIAGKRSTRGGRASVRSGLYPIVTVLVRHNPDFAAKHAALKAKGKAPKSIRIALLRKLVVRLNAIARDVRKALAESQHNAVAA
ncbi:IS110 family transposase [Salinarimonas sp.]|uniref:IS110 family transposase n=2 Tax=Salinarimonas sp. TaxID=2766526 RepID=UPI0032D985FE